ncbi:rhodanese-like domain-containing protein [Terasakiella sp. A23]|uniref:rhodanese-like domain-containing protein n=1 Tax=Terasakiella sp. FCG-A23 TaxID=3080561 RepID=UPI0029541B42|nr:rhodanese-like domain-containing protein [Terasakiella sp. A23]MDV7338786.1 rhodanese-like domain-containing protein [Terasakiella sp. A23]
MDSPMVTAVLVVVIAFASFRLLPRLLAGVPFVSPDAVKARMEDDENAVMIDVRTPEEFATEHVPDSLNVQPYELGEDIEAKRPYMDHKVYVMCLTAQRSAMAAKTLKNLGFKNVSVVKGGLKLWKKQGLPTTTS